MTYKTEFPGFADMPDIPETWRDISWHNDACPSFEFMAAGEGDSNYQFARVWIAESDPALRDFPDCARFQVSYEAGQEDFKLGIATDSWSEVLLYVETRQKLGAAYAKTIGYNPFLDEPLSDPDTIAESLYVTRRLFKLETAQ